MSHTRHGWAGCVTLAIVLIGLATPLTPHASPERHLRSRGRLAEGALLPSVTFWLLPVPAAPTACVMARGKLYVCVSEANQLLVIAPEEQRLLKAVAFPHRPALLASDDNRRRVYVSSPDSNKLLFVDTATLATSQAAELPSPAAGLTLNRAGTRAYICAASLPALYVVDLPRRAVVETIGLSAPGFQPRLLQAQGKLYVGSGTEAGPDSNWTAPATIDVVDLNAGRVTTTLQLPGMTVRALALDPDRRFLYAAATARAELVKIDTERDTLVEGFQVTVGGANDIIIDGQRQKVYLSCGGADQQLAVVDLRTQREEFRIPAGEGFMAAQSDGSGRLQTLYVPRFNGDLIAVVDLARLFGE